jgi:thiamine phosphate synthase YjbQ (UPF0047 family)
MVQLLFRSILSVTVVIGIIITIDTLSAFRILLHPHPLHSLQRIPNNHRMVTTQRNPWLNSVVDHKSDTVTTVPMQQERQQLGSPICLYDEIKIPMKISSNTTSGTDATNIIPQQEVIVYDITKQIRQYVIDHHVSCGTVTIYNRHTTTSLLINEYESRLIRDMIQTFLPIIPPDERSYAATRFTGTSNVPTGIRYEHNDIHLRPESYDEMKRCYENGYNISNINILQQWRNQEPINAHSHLLSMMIGTPTLSIPIYNTTIMIGLWQSIMLIDFDAPRNRTIGIQINGYTNEQVNETM